MAKNKVNITDIDKLIDPNNETELEWRGLTISVKPILSFKEMTLFVETTTRSCLSDETGEYFPEAQDFVFRCSVIEYYTNISLPEDIHKRYDFVIRTDIIPFIMDIIDKTQLSFIVKAVENKIDYITQSNADVLKRQMDDIVANFSLLQDRLNNLFNGFDKEAISKVLEVFADKDFNENKIVKKISEYVNNNNKVEHNEQDKI